MIAYTAWDSLGAIARDQHAQLSLAPDGGVRLCQYRQPIGAGAEMAGFAARVRLALDRLSRFW